MSIDLDDPFALVADTRVSHRGELIQNGRYRLPNRDGSPRGGVTELSGPYGAKGWMRTTNLVSAHSDQYALRSWEHEHIYRSVVLDPGGLLLADLADSVPTWDDITKYQRKLIVEGFLERSKAITGANRGARHGTHRHALVEEWHEDEQVGLHWTAGGRRDVALYASAMVRNGLQAMPGMQERQVLIECLEAAGSLDNILTDMASKAIYIGDLKTQKKFWTFLEVKAQLACYANADAMWEWAEDGSGRWVDMPPVDRETAFALWMPRKPDDPEQAAEWEPRVDVLELDIVQGWKSAKLAYEIVQDRASGRTGARLRKAPSVTLTEQYAARFAAVETLAEGSALVAEARKAGVWDEILAGCARAAHARIAR